MQTAPAPHFFHVKRPVANAAVKVTIGMLAAAALLAACSSNAPSTQGSTTSTAATGGSQTTQAGAGGPIAAIATELGKERHATFKAVWVAKPVLGVSGFETTYRFEQKPPYILVSYGAIEDVINGTGAYTCNLVSQTVGWKCAKVLWSADEVWQAAAILNPTAIINSMEAAARSSSGGTVRTSSANFAGQPSTCVMATGAMLHGTVNWCVTHSGFLAHEVSPSQSITLQSLSSSVPDSDFTPPGPVT